MPGKNNNVFQRIETKYLLSQEQYRQLMDALAPHIQPDPFPHSTICNLYYDTPDFRLIRASLDKPVYKEKLRLRTYSVPESPTAPAFVELKKKFKGVVYKRRETMPLQEAERYLNAGIHPDRNTQIIHELDWFLHSYEELHPSVFLSYERDSWFCTDDPRLRITFDWDICYRTQDLVLSHGIYGTQLLQPGQRLMELKVPGALPVWLAHLLDSLNIRKSSFSKYGKAYQAMCADAKSDYNHNNNHNNNHNDKGVIYCA